MSYRFPQTGLNILRVIALATLCMPFAHAQQDQQKQSGKVESLGKKLQSKQLVTAPTKSPNDSRNIAVTAAERRVALVIGNSAYPGTGALKNPVNDAKDIAAKLKRLGFDVIVRTDMRHKEMLRSLTDFGDKVQTGTEALFFYAGHGMQVRGKNYLLPIDAEIRNEASASSEAVDVDQLLDKLSQARVSVVILDACRNNPFERRFRGSGQGLAQINAPTGTLIAYATAPGKVAADGDGRNGLYTTELLKAMDVPSIKIEDVFKRVRSNVVRKSNDAQTPWESSSLTGDFYFSGGTQVTSLASTQPIDADIIELESWKSAQQLDTVEGYQAYLAEYPQGRYTRLSNAAIGKLQNLANSQTSSVGIGAAAQGNTCSAHGQCGPGLFCLGGMCRAQVGEGERCTENTDCTGTLLCSQGTCRPPSSRGAGSSNGATAANAVWESLLSQNTLGPAIVRCFHPTAIYSGANFQSAPYISSDARNIRGDGRVVFLGGLSRKTYEMRFSMELQSNAGAGILIRVTPTSDTAPFPANTSCPLRNWQRL